MLKRFFLTTLTLASILSPISAEDLTPGAPFDYASMAFYPDRWKEKGLNEAPMIPWSGKNIALVTSDTPLDAKVITRFVAILDKGWDLYAELTGRSPRLFKNVNGKATICALPANGLSCGYGCGYVGATGIEMIRFYDGHYKAAQKDPRNVPHAYFYEMGRNYFTYGNKHNCFTTGFAVFMRYVCIDTLQLNDGDKRTRQVIDDAIDIYEKSPNLDFIGTFTTHGTHGEKGNRLKDKDGKVIRPTDQNVLYASLMLKLSKENGGNAFVKEFYHQLHTVPGERARDSEGALRQCIALMVCSSLAANKDLTPLFADNYRLPVGKEAREILAKINWKSTKLSAGDVIKKLPATLAMGAKR